MARKTIRERGKDALTVEQRIQLIGVKSVLTLDEAALYTGLKVKTLYVQCCAGTIPYYKSKGGNFNYFKKAELDAWMTAQDMQDGRTKALYTKSRGSERL